MTIETLRAILVWTRGAGSRPGPRLASRRVLGVALVALVALVATSLPFAPAEAHDDPGRWTHYGHYYHKMYNVRLCMRIDTGTPKALDWLYGDELVGMTVAYHAHDGTWKAWRGAWDKATLWKDNTANNSTRYAWNCSDVFSEAWVRQGHEAMHAYVGTSKTDSRAWSKYVHKDSRPYKANMSDHWDVHHGHNSEGWIVPGATTTHWCFVAGRDVGGVEARWWLHLKAVTGSTNCSGI